MIEPVIEIAPLREAFYKVFSSRDPFDPAGRDELTVKAVLYPTRGYHLEAEQFRALTRALEDCGGQEFYISMVEWEPEHRVWGVEENSHWRCRKPTLREYEGAGLYLENALYSASGSWGVLLSHEDHALLVCRDELWESFERYYPDWRNDYAEFIEFWKGVEGKGVNVNWLKPFLAHLTKSPETARRT